MDAMGPMPYAALNGMIDPAFPKAARNYWKAQFLTDLSDDAIRTLIAGFQECPSPMSHIIIEHFHGAASRVPVTATACPMRVTGFNVVIASQWMDSKETERGIRWARERSRPNEGRAGQHRSHTNESLGKGGSSARNISWAPLIRVVQR